MNLRFHILEVMGVKNHEKQASQVWIKNVRCYWPIRICFTVLFQYGEDENYDPTLEIVGSEVSKLARNYQGC